MGHARALTLSARVQPLTNDISVVMANAGMILLAPSRKWLSDVYLPHSPIVAPGHEDVCGNTDMSDGIKHHKQRHISCTDGTYLSHGAETTV